MHPEIPLLLQTTFPALTDTDVEHPWDHAFHVQKCIAYRGILNIHAILDGTITLLLEYDTSSRILKLLQTSEPLDVDIVGLHAYTTMRTLFEYEGGPHPEEACVIGTESPLQHEACFLPTFGAGGPCIPYILLNILLSKDTAMTHVVLPSIAHL